MPSVWRVGELETWFTIHDIEMVREAEYEQKF